MTYNEQLSLELSNRVPTVPKQCWSNAVRALRTCRKQLSDALYVEGHILIYGTVYLEHGWLTLPDETIIDTTRAYIKTHFNDEPDDRLYYPVATYSLDDLKGVRLEDLPLSIADMRVWEFQHYYERMSPQSKQAYLQGRTLDEYLVEMRENYRKQVGK